MTHCMSVTDGVWSKCPL